MATNPKFNRSITVLAYTGFVESKKGVAPTIQDRLGEVQSGILRRGGQGSQEVTGKTVSHLRQVSMQS